jgi:hypothetical protein
MYLTFAAVPGGLTDYLPARLAERPESPPSPEARGQQPYFYAERGPT